MLYRRLFLLSGLCGLCLAGCGGSSEPGRHAIWGTVSVNGTSIAKGSISFLPSQGVSGPPATTLIEEGEYRFAKENGPFAGAYRVVIGIELEPVADGGSAAAAAAGLSSGIKVAPPPEDARRYRPGPPKSTPPKTQWETQCTIEENGDDQKDFDVSG
jgi:hypothetical protein